MARKIEEGIEFWDTGEDGFLDKFNSDPEVNQALEEYFKKHPEEKTRKD